FDDPPALEALRPDAPAALSAVVRRLLAKRAEDRFQTPAELVEALTPLTNAAPAASSKPTTVERAEAVEQDTAGSATNAFAAMDGPKAVPPPAVVSRRRLLIAVGSGLLVVGLLVWLLSRTPEKP